MCPEEEKEENGITHTNTHAQIQAEKYTALSNCTPTLIGLLAYAVVQI